jgi:hypothetical protein
MKKQSKIKNGFYKGYIQDQQLKLIDKPKEQLVLVNQRENDGFAKVLFVAIGAVFRAICYITLFLLSSIGLTAVINESIRQILIKIIT